MSKLICTIENNMRTKQLKLGKAKEGKKKQLKTKMNFIDEKVAE